MGDYWNQTSIQLTLWACRDCELVMLWPVPGGYLGMVTVKLEGPTNRKRGGGWNGYRRGWHTILFTPDTLQQCLAKVGVEEVKRPRRARPFDDILILWGRKPL